MRVLGSAILLALVAGACVDLPLEPSSPGDGGSERWLFSFTSDREAGDAGPFLSVLSATDTTMRIAVRIDRPIAFTALAYELVVEGGGVVVDSLLPGPDLAAGWVHEWAPGAAPGRLIGVVSLEGYEQAASVDGIVAIAVARRTTDGVFDVHVGLDAGTTRFYGADARPLDLVVAGGHLLYRVVGGS